MSRPGYRTDAQKHGARMRAKGRDYRGGYTRQEIKSGAHKLHTCRVRGCSARSKEKYCPKHRGDDNADGARQSKSDNKLAAELIDKYSSKELRDIASQNGVSRKRGDTKKQTAWRIVKQNRDAAKAACY